MGLGFGCLLLIISVLLWNYARTAANRTYDLLLAGAALSILERVAPGPDGPIVDLPYSAMEILALAPQERVVYRVFAADGRRITGADDLPTPPQDAATPAFFDAVHSGAPFRFVVQQRRLNLPDGPDAVTVQVGHTREARRAQQLSLFLNGMAGLAVVSAIGLGFVWLAIRRALLPLRQIEADLRERDPRDLSKVDAVPPQEIRSLFDSINGFIDRLRANRQLTETFIADVAHQTRTSLAALHGQLSLAADAADFDEMRGRVAKAEAQAQRTVRLTNQLLSHAMVIHRSDRAALHPVALTPLVRDQLAEMLRDSRMREVTLTFDADGFEDGGDVVAGDEVSIREAIRNLIDNAVRHGPPDNTIDIALRPQEGGRIALSVSDAGPGIPTERRREAIQRFTSLARSTAGSGLGLAIVKAVADSHDADLRLETSGAGGLSVVLSFPPAARSRDWVRTGAVAAILLAGCIGPGSDAVAQGRTLNVFSATDAAAMEPLVAGFEATYPDIQVDYREFQTVDLHEALLNAATEPRADVVISPAMDLQVDLVNRGLARRLDLVEAAAIPPWALWRSELFGFTFEPAAIIYNKAAFESHELPSNHRDLASLIRDQESRLLGRIGAYDLRESGIGYLYATQDLVQGAEAQRIAEVLGRAGVRLYCCTSEMAEATARGDLLLAVNVIGSYALDAAQRDPRLGVLFLDDYNLVMTRTAFVPQDAPNADLGALFVAFLLSDDGQRLIAESPLIPIRPAAGPENEPMARLRARTATFLPIRLGPGLLTYLDALKRERFLASWEAALARDIRPAE